MKRNKLTSIILSVLIAFCLWLYVVTYVSREDDATFYNIPVVMEGESALNEQNLMLTAISTNTVSLHLSGARSDLTKVDASNLTVRVDLSKIKAPGERIALSYTPNYPSEVSSDAFAIESKNPTSIFVNVEYRGYKEIPVKVKYVGTRSEDYLYDTENVVLDSSFVSVNGPASVVDQIESAEVEVDLTNRFESISETYRYTLCNAEGEPVDAAQITTNVEQIRVDMQIQRIKELMLKVDLIHGGGTTDRNTVVTLEPETIRVSGSDTVLDALGDTYTIGSVDLTLLERTSNEVTRTISLPEGVTNQTGVTEVKVKVSFTGLKTRDLVLENIQCINVPEGMEVELISANVTVKFRGPAAQIDGLSAEDIVAQVDFAGAEMGTATYRVTIVLPEGFPDVGPLRAGTVSAIVRAEVAEEE